jgi:hypothetical protein
MRHFRSRLYQIKNNENSSPMKGEMTGASIELEKSFKP